MKYKKLIRAVKKATNMQRKGFGSMRDLIRLAKALKEVEDGRDSSSR